MDWGSIASAVGGAAKEAMSNAPEASGLHQSAAAERHAHQREIDETISMQQAKRGQAQKEYMEELINAWGNARKNFSGTPFNQDLFNLSMPSSVSSVWDMSAGKDKQKQQSEIYKKNLLARQTSRYSDPYEK